MTDQSIGDAGAPEGTGSPSPYTAPEVELLLRQLTDIIEAARPVPLSASSMINKDEVLEMLYDIGNRLPDELRSARWLLREREEFLARVRREGDELTDLARARAERMVQNTEVVKAAESRARQVIEHADAEARRLKMEAEDFCDQKLGSFEAVLERTMKVVSDGRARLQGDVLHDLASPSDALHPAGAAPDQPIDAEHAGFYDQDDGGHPI